MCDGKVGWVGLGVGASRRNRLGLITESEQPFQILY